MKASESSDRELVRRVLAGEAAAFRALFRAYYPALYRFALARLDRDDDAAEEVVQLSLSKAFRKLATYRGEASLLTWLCGFCRFEVLDHYRRRHRAPARVELAEEIPEIRAALESVQRSDATSPEARLLRQELGRQVRRALDHLPRRYAAALEWKYLDGRSVREIAERLDLGPKAAESLLTRARNAFREAFPSSSTTTAERAI